MPHDVQATYTLEEGSAGGEVGGGGGLIRMECLILVSAPLPPFYFASPPLQEVIHTISMCVNEIEFVLASGVKESYLV